MTKTFDKKEAFVIQQVSHPGVQRKSPSDDAIVCFGMVSHALPNI